jgi:tetratricopeptide (TPR) repeat protein/SAM-dependent methyltransferase
MTVNLNEDSANVAQLLQTGQQFHLRGELEQAAAMYRGALRLDPQHGDALYLCAVVAMQTGNYDVAVPLLEKVSCIRPADAEVRNNFGVALKETGRWSEAIAQYRSAIAANPNFAEAHANLGAALRVENELDGAVESYRRALALKPEHPGFMVNLGNTLSEKSSVAEAETWYRAALRINPGLVDAHNNLGVILLDRKRHDEAAACFRAALAIKPDYVDALNNLARILIADSEWPTALNVLGQSLAIKGTGLARELITQCVTLVEGVDSATPMRNYIVRGLAEGWGRSRDLARAGIGLVKRDPEIASAVALATAAWPRRLSMGESLGPIGLSKVAENALLRALLVSTPICSIELERLLTSIRGIVLDAALSVTDIGIKAGLLVDFGAVLARQCFINDYVFDVADGEAEQIRILRDSITAAIEAGPQIPALRLVAAAAYFPLHTLPHAERLCELSWPTEVTVLLTQQVREPMTEQQYRAVIPRITPIRDEVSLEVRQQYEENPYPRWVSPPNASRCEALGPMLRNGFPLHPFRPFSIGGNPDILIAGCGTGQHPVGVAQRIKGARVLAIDLSLASLCYAERKTQELGLSTIEYAQADILELGGCSRRFDQIESVGVLHHLANPLQGWRVLLTLLRPGGFMRIGLYSEVARRDIVRARAYIADRGYLPNVDDIRRCRQELTDAGADEGFRSVAGMNDFFSLSECRDLLFHTQEHRMTLSEINAFVDQNDLAFMGFDLDSNVIDKYRRQFPDDPAATNLKHWQEFEIQNPNTFLGMYIFFVQGR